MNDRLTRLPADALTDRLASSDPAPGGGSASALAGALAAALLEMVVALTRGRPAAGRAEEELAEIGARAGHGHAELLELVDRDAAAYDAVIRARRLPRDSDAERGARDTAVRDATRGATRAPLETARSAHALIALAERLVPIANRHAISDVGVAALLASASLRGAALNVRINLPFLPAEDDLRAVAGTELNALERDLDERVRRIAEAVAEQLG